MTSVDAHFSHILIYRSLNEYIKCSRYFENSLNLDPEYLKNALWSIDKMQIILSFNIIAVKHS